MSERPASAGSSIVVLRLLLLLVAAGAAFAGMVIAFHGRDSGDLSDRYACPMHPEVRAHTAGQCPICQMALESLSRASGGNGKGHGARDEGMPGMSDVTAVENVRKHKIIDFVRVRSVLPNLREIRGPAWAENDHEISAILYNDQIAALGPEEPGGFWASASPQAPVAVARMVGPVIARDRSTSVIRFRIDKGTASAGALRGGQVGWIQLASHPRSVLGVPTSALLQSPEGPYVLAWAGGQGFEKRSIELGEIFLRQGFAVVLSGLRANERVVSRATFFLDADRRSFGKSDTGWGAP